MKGGIVMYKKKTSLMLGLIVLILAIGANVAFGEDPVQLTFDGGNSWATTSNGAIAWKDAPNAFTGGRVWIWNGESMALVPESSNVVIPLLDNGMIAWAQWVQSQHVSMEWDVYSDTLYDSHKYHTSNYLL
jgi:hypothetical protein